MKILFVCKYNRFRSKIAESYFNNINKNKKIKAVSGGIFRGVPTPQATIRTAKSLGIRIGSRPCEISEERLKKTDKVIIVANDVPKSVFRDYDEKVIVWKISDTSVKNQKQVKNIIKEIMKKVENLNKKLKIKNENK